jgi:hypothetical protein
LTVPRDFCSWKLKRSANNKLIEKNCVEQEEKIEKNRRQITGGEVNEP